MKPKRASSIKHRVSRELTISTNAIRNMRYEIRKTIHYSLFTIHCLLLTSLFLLLFLFLPGSLGAEEPAREKPISAELPTVVVKGRDRSYLEITRPRISSLMQHRGEKSSLQPPFETELAEKIYYRLLSFPELELEKLPSLGKPLMEKRKEIYPVALLEAPLKKSFVSWYTPRKYVRAKETSLMQYREEKGLVQPLIQLPLAEKIYYPGPKEESRLPYFHISASLGGYDSFAYQLDYGKEKEKIMYFLTLGGASSSQGVKYKETSLAKDEDWLNMEFIWDSSKERRMLFNLDGYQKRINLPEGGEESKNKLDLKGSFTLKWQKDKILRAFAWLERTELIEEAEYYQEITPGVQIELEKPDISLYSGIKAEYSSYTNNQIHLWARKEAMTFKKLKDITGEVEIGIKQIGEASEIIPHLKILYQIDSKREFQVVLEKEFYPLKFTDLYLFPDYVEVNEDPDFNKIVRLWSGESKFKYKLSPGVDFSLEGFFRTGQDIIWNWNGVSLVKPESRPINSWGGKLNLRHFGETFEQGLSYAFQGAKNALDSDKVIPYYPASIADIWLRWKKNTWRVEAKAQFFGERYYEEETEDKLPPAWKGMLKVSKAIGKKTNLYIQLELNDYKLWKDYSLPEGKLSLGIKVNLY